MARYTGALCKRCRREGVKLYLKGTRCYTEKCSMEVTRKPYPPGQHGPTPSHRLTDYGLRLREKQKLKMIYGVMERQCRRYFEMARKVKGSTAEAFLVLLERRLDNVIYRAGFAVNRRQARQLVAHGHIIVNDRKVDIPSYLVRLGDTVKVKSKMKELVKTNLSASSSNSPPSWLSVNEEELSVEVKAMPTRSEIDVPVNEYLIVEYYSR